MLMKLLKYEGKATARVLVPVGCGVLVFTLLVGLANTVLNRQENLPTLLTILQILLNMIAGLGLLFAVGACVFMQVQRFYKLLGEQGYLMLSLPVPVWKHIIAKLLCAGIWSVIGVLYWFLGAAILSGGSIYGNLWQGTLSVSPAGILLVLEVVLLLVALLAGFYLEFYLACAIGGQFGQQRLLASIIAYFVLGFVEQIVGTLVMLFVIFGAIQNDVTDSMSVLYTLDTAWVTVLAVTALLIAVLALDVIKWAVTQWLMTSRLHLA